MARGLVLLVAVAGAACRGNGSHASIDLVAELPRAEKRAIAPAMAIRTGLAGPADNRRMSLVTDAPARITWTLQLPAHAHVRTAVCLVPDANGAIGGGASARIGISDNRRYQELVRVILSASSPANQWQAIDLDLGEYSGWKFSIFYRPSSRDWHIVFAADPVPRGAIAWAQPAIVGR